LREASLEGPGIRRSRPRLTVLACLTIGGCVAGPNFKPPPSPETSGYSARPLATTVGTPDVASGQAQRFVSGADIPGDWWILFHSQPLDALIDEALAQP
jgi:outer membrane protein TolC